MPTVVLVPLEFVAGSTVASAVKQLHIDRRDTAGSKSINLDPGRPMIKSALL
jgi:hypothetical protein